MKELILEFLEYAEPEIKTENIEILDNDPGIDVKRLADDRKRTMYEWKSNSKGIYANKVENRTH
jgi:hypothetical protein